MRDFVVPDSMKFAAVTPLLKKPSLDINNLKNYWFLLFFAIILSRLSLISNYYHYFIYLSSTILYYANHITLSVKRHSSIELWRMRLISVSK